jgi:aromatic ring-opening dioxygenase catalytic subunit (LigB family)
MGSHVHKLINHFSPSVTGFAAWWESWKEWITKTVRTKRTEDTLQSFHLLTYIIKITVRKLAVKQDRFADFGFDG